MVGGEHHDGVVGHARRVERFEDAPDRLIDQLLQRVVEAPVPLVGLLLVDHLPPELGPLLLTGRAARERVGLRRRFGNRRHRVIGRRQLPDLIRHHAVCRDVVGIHERRDREPRPVVACLRELTEELHHLLREHSVAHRAALGPGRAVRLTADPPGEPERVEPVGLAIGGDRLRDRVPVDVGGHQALVAPRDEQVGEGDVPLPPVVRLVPAGAEPVAERRHRVGIQPHHGRVVVLLRRPVGLRHAVQRRVLTGEQCRRDSAYTPSTPRSGDGTPAHPRATTRGRRAAPCGTSPAPSSSYGGG